MAKIKPVIILLLILSAQSKYVLESRWQDVANIVSPYEKNDCEFAIAKQISSTLRKINVNPKMVGVVFERPGKCFSGPHSLFYYMGYRGRYDSVDSLLKYDTIDNFDVMINIYDKSSTEIPGWIKVVDLPLHYSAYGYRYAVYARKTKIKGYAKYGIGRSQAQKDGLLISGVVNGEYKTGFRFSDLKLPLYSKINVSIRLKNLHNSTHAGYILLRSHMGGYSKDQMREINFDNGVKEIFLNVEFITDNLDDYVIEFGERGVGAYAIISEMEIKHSSIFLDVQ